MTKQYQIMTVQAIEKGNLVVQLTQPTQKMVKAPAFRKYRGTGGAK